MKKTKASEIPPALDGDTQNRIDKAQKTARARKREELAVLHAKGQLALWPENERGIPNELVRLFVKEEVFQGRLDKVSATSLQ